MQQAITKSQIRVTAIGGQPVASGGVDWLKRGLVCALATAVLSVAMLCVFSRQSAATQPETAVTVSAGSLWAE